MFLTKDLLNDGFVGSEEGNQEHIFRVLPNPTAGVLIIDGFKGNVMVYDSHGKRQLMASSNILDISSLAAGIYYCILELDGMAAGKAKFVVVK